MVDRVRRGVLGGFVLAGASLGITKAVSAQAVLADPQAPVPDPQSVADAVQSVAAPDGDVVTVAQARVPQDWANLNRYSLANRDAMRLPAFNRRAVLMGDSITDAWPSHAADIFAKNGLIGRGIGGQTTAQMVVRFTPDVIALRPVVVHIMAGTNDIAENLDPYDFTATSNNLMAMAAMARSNAIRVVMGSVPPATSFAWRTQLGNRSEQIVALNAWLRQYCADNGYVYADYWSVLNDGQGGLKPELGFDSVHPNAQGYAVMNPVALTAIDVAMTR